jgi:hypothetical protein
MDTLHNELKWIITMFVEPADIVNFMIAHAPIREMMRDEILIKQYIANLVEIRIRCMPCVQPLTISVIKIYKTASNKKCGYVIYFYKSGMIQSIINRRHGILHGVRKYYHDNGAKAIYDYFNNGILIRTEKFMLNDEKYWEDDVEAVTYCPFYPLQTLNEDIIKNRKQKLIDAGQELLKLVNECPCNYVRFVRQILQKYELN